MFNKHTLPLLVILYVNLIASSIPNIEQQIADLAIQRRIIARHYKVTYEPNKHKLLPVLNGTDYENSLLAKQPALDFVTKQRLCHEKSLGKELKEATQPTILHKLITLEENMLSSKKSLLQAYVDYQSNCAKNVLTYGGAATLLGAAGLYWAHSQGKISEKDAIMLGQSVIGLVGISSVVYLKSQEQPIDYVQFSLDCSELHRNRIKEKLSNLNETSNTTNYAKGNHVQ